MADTFEDLIAWQKARVLTKLIYEATSTGQFAKDFGLRDQIQRASVSVMCNIAEGYERQTPNDYFRFLAIAKASCAEVRCQLYVALDVGYLTPEHCNSLRALAIEVSRIISGLQASIHRR
jgi:four helix bundle protein